jgi:hypothetical protein
LIALIAGLHEGVGLESHSTALIEDLVDLARSLCMLEVMHDPVIFVS